MPSPFEILLEISKKRRGKKDNGSEGNEDNEEDNAEDEVYNAKFLAAWEKYKELFKAKYGEDMNPEKHSPDFSLYDMIEEVMPGLKYGRRLGFGPLSQSSYYESREDPGSSVENVFNGPSHTQTQLEEEVLKRKALELEVAAMKETATKQEALLRSIEERLNGPVATSSNVEKSIPTDM